MPEGSPLDKKTRDNLLGFAKMFGSKIPDEAMTLLNGISNAKRYFVIPVTLNDEPVIITGLVLKEKIPVKPVYDPVDFLYVIRVAEKLRKYLEQPAQSESGGVVSETG